MRQLRILTWPSHGSYFNALSTLNHDWFLPVKPDAPEGFGGRGDPLLPSSIHETAADAVRDLDLHLVLLQSPQNLRTDAPEILSPAQQQLPRIYLEHNAPFPDPVNSRHPFGDSDGMLVHVTHYNALMWDNGGAQTQVIEHSVAIDPSVAWQGTRPEGITVINSMPRRGR